MSRKSAPDRTNQNTEARPRKETVLKAVLCTLVCLWMFVLGLLVGRGTAPVRFNVERLQDELAALKATTIDETTQHYRVAFQDLDQEMDLGFHEALKDEKTELPKTLPSTAAAKPETSKQTTPKPAASAPAQTETPKEKAEAAVPKKTKASEPQKTEAPDTSKPWVIQVAATQDEAQGTQLVQRLKKSGYPAYLTKVAIPDKGTWFRVRVGGYASREAAESDLVKLEKERYSPMIITP